MYIYLLSNSTVIVAFLKLSCTSSSKNFIEISKLCFLDMKIMSRGSGGYSVNKESVGYNNNTNGSGSSIVMLLIVELSHLDSTICCALSVTCTKATTIKVKESGFV